MDNNEVKTAVETLGKTFESFKEANDERLAQVEAKGTADPVTEAKLSKIEKDMDKFADMEISMKAQAETQKQNQESMAKLETIISRPGFGNDSKIESKQVQVFDKWLRKGKENLSPDEVKVLTVGNDSTAGYLAPPEYVRELIKGIVEYSPIRSIARIRSTSQRSIQVPKRTGEFTAQWVAEQGTRSETTGYTVGLDEIAAHELYALIDISEMELEDSVFNLEAEMNSEFTEQFAKAEGAAFVSGDSIGKPEGILTGLPVARSQTSIANDVLSGNDLINAAHNVKAEYARNGSFIMSRSTLAAVRKLQDTAGQYIFQPGVYTMGVGSNILGHPIVECTDMPAIANGSVPVVFGDFRRGYMIVDRTTLSIMRDPFTQANTGNVRYIARRRVGGQVILDEALTKITIQ
jgi:HK97 family phage major capsid protein